MLLLPAAGPGRNHQPALLPSDTTTTTFSLDAHRGKVPLTRRHTSTSCACGAASTATPHGGEPPADVTIRAYVEAEKGLCDCSSQARRCHLCQSRRSRA